MLLPIRVGHPMERPCLHGIKFPVVIQVELNTCRNPVREGGARKGLPLIENAGLALGFQKL